MAVKGLGQILSWLVFLPVLRIFGASLYPQIPAIASFTSVPGSFELSPDVRIVVDSEHGLEGAPSALTFAETFRTDLMSVAGYDYVLPVEVLPSGSGFIADDGRL